MEFLTCGMVCIVVAMMMTAVIISGDASTAWVSPFDQ